MVETRDWAVSRLILKNGQPLPPAQRQREEERLRSLLTNRARLLRLQTEKHVKDARSNKVIKALPDEDYLFTAPTEIAKRRGGVSGGRARIEVAEEMRLFRRNGVSP